MVPPQSEFPQQGVTPNWAYPAVLNLFAHMFNASMLCNKQRPLARAMIPEQTQYAYNATTLSHDHVHMSTPLAPTSHIWRPEQWLNHGDCNTITVRCLNDPLQLPLQVRSPLPVTSHSSLQCLHNNVSKHDFKLCSLNVRSINNKTLCIRELIIDNYLDIKFLCETWLGTDYDETSISEFLPPGYKLLHQAHTNQRGGGVGIVYKGVLEMV